MSSEDIKHTVPKKLYKTKEQATLHSGVYFFFFFFFYLFVFLGGWVTYIDDTYMRYQE